MRIKNVPYMSIINVLNYTQNVLDKCYCFCTNFKPQVE